MSGWTWLSGSRASHIGLERGTCKTKNSNAQVRICVRKAKQVYAKVRLVWVKKRKRGAQACVMCWLCDQVMWIFLSLDKKERNNWKKNYYSTNRALYHAQYLKLISSLLLINFIYPLLISTFASSQTFFFTFLYNHQCLPWHSYLHRVIRKSQHTNSHSLRNLQPWKHDISHHVIFFDIFLCMVITRSKRKRL